jgi:hypothetical protein
MLSTEESYISSLLSKLSEARDDRQNLRDADRDGFGFFSYQSLAGAATAYWFGSYTAIA